MAVTKFVVSTDELGDTRYMQNEDKVAKMPKKYIFQTVTNLNKWFPLFRKNSICLVLRNIKRIHKTNVSFLFVSTSELHGHMWSECLSGVLLLRNEMKQLKCDIM